MLTVPRPLISVLHPASRPAARLAIALGILLALAASTLAPSTVAHAAEAAASAPAIHPAGFRFEAEPGHTITVVGVGRFADTVEVYPGPDGKLVVVNELSLDQYVEGLAEVPATWPMESLKAQAVAARTYAWYSERLGTYLKRGLDFDICGSTACQVFHGAEVVATPVIGQRWQQAVAETAGEALTYEDQPILARFFAASGGATRNNEHVWPSNGPRPYLVGVPDPDEAGSPLALWDVSFTRAQMDRILAEGKTLSAAVPAVGFERILADGENTDLIRITRDDGHQVDISASKFRAWVSEQAPKLFPGSFPQRRGDGGRMPITMPSSRLEFEVTPERVLVHGFGWGHGVGMSQWGAKGKAERGMTYDQILASYYGGLEPVVDATAPQRIRVGMVWDASTVAVRTNGPATIGTASATAPVAPGSTFQFGSHSTAAVRTDGPVVTWQPRTEPTRRIVRRPVAPDPTVTTTEDAHVAVADRLARALVGGDTEDRSLFEQVGAVLVPSLHRVVRHALLPFSLGR